LTGNYLEPARLAEDYDSDEEDYPLDYGDMEIEEMDDEDEEEDELDDMEDPRITEMGDGEEEVPKLVTATQKAGKSKNKRAAEESEDEPSTLDDMITKTLNVPADEAEKKLSKKQLKKLKNNEGKAVPAEPDTKKDATTAAKEKESPASGKKVQFAKNLEQGPTGSPKVNGTADEKSDKPQAGTVKVIQGVKIEDKKIGTGKAAKKGDKISMRYIGKLEKTSEVFDCECSVKLYVPSSY